MKRSLQLIILLIAAAAGYFAWTWMNPSPEKAIQKQMEKLAETLQIKPAEGNIARVAAINKTLSFFTSQIVINGDGMSQFNETIQGRTELQQALFAARQRLDGGIQFYDIHIRVDPGATNAVCDFTAVARQSGQNDSYRQDVRAHFQKIDSAWLINRVDPIALKPPSAGNPE